MCIRDRYKRSPYTGAEVTNQFEDADANYWFEDCVTYLTRQDWAGTFPTEPVTGLALTDEMLTLLNGDLYEKPEDAPSVSAYTQGENQGCLLYTSGPRAVPFPAPLRRARCRAPH